MRKRDPRELEKVLDGLPEAWRLETREDLAEALADVARAVMAGKVLSKDANAAVTAINALSAEMDRIEADAAEAEAHAQLGGRPR